MTRIQPEVITIGECMALIYPNQPVSLNKAGTLKFDMAGAESNFAIALSRLNHSVRFITRLGKDPFGNYIRQVLEQEKVVVDGVLDSEDAPTGLFFREWLTDGQRRVYYYRAGSAASQLTPSDLKAIWFQGVKILHLTGITPALSRSCLQTCWKAIELAKKNHLLISFDPNYRSPLWDYDTAREVLFPFAQKADFLLLGHEDAFALFNTKNDDEILRAAGEAGPKITVLKRAERGALALIENKIVEVEAYPVSEVKDPVGAGDGFDAGFIAGYLRGWDAGKSLQLAAKVGALAVTTMGDYHGYPKGL
jgi:2-dehydro-3-deoxygluconokinase